MTDREVRNPQAAVVELLNAGGLGNRVGEGRELYLSAVPAAREAARVFP